MRLLSLSFVILSGALFVGCGDGDSDEVRELCDGPGCVNSADCPAEEPSDGDACDFSGNCHYCDVGETLAEGYGCDGTSFTAYGEFECEPA